MRNLQIIGNVPQVRRESNFGEYAEEAVIIEEPVIKQKRPLFIEANTIEASLEHLRNDCIIPRIRKGQRSYIISCGFYRSGTGCNQYIL